jgi:hypothetical protein
MIGWRAGDVCYDFDVVCSFGDSVFDESCCVGGSETRFSRGQSGIWLCLLPGEVAPMPALRMSVSLL